LIQLVSDGRIGAAIAACRAAGVRLPPSLAARLWQQHAVNLLLGADECGDDEEDGEDGPIGEAGEDEAGDGMADVDSAAALRPHADGFMSMDLASSNASAPSALYARSRPGRPRPAPSPAQRVEGMEGVIMTRLIALQQAHPEDAAVGAAVEATCGLLLFAPAIAAAACDTRAPTAAATDGLAAGAATSAGTGGEGVGAGAAAAAHASDGTGASRGAAAAAEAGVASSIHLASDGRPDGVAVDAAGRVRALRLPALAEALLAPARHAETVQLFRAALFEAQATGARAAPEGGLARGAAVGRELASHAATAAASTHGDTAGAAASTPENGTSNGRSGSRGSDGVGGAHGTGRRTDEDSTGREGVSLLRALLMLQQQASSSASS
jgi:hypothetical protein